MFSKPRDTGPVGTPPIVGLPSPEDLQFLLDEAVKNRKRTVELSFKTVGGTRRFTIAVQCDMETGDAGWILTSITQGGSRVVWTYTSQDLGLMHDLIRGEFESATADEDLGLPTTEVTPYASANSYAPSNPNDRVAVPDQKSAGAQAGIDRPANAASDTDNPVIQSFLASVCQPDTGLFAYPAFVYFVDQEYRRLCLGGHPFSIAIFKMRFREADGRISAHELTPDAIRAAALRIADNKRDIDLLAHYGPFDFAALLPQTDSNGAEGLVRRFEQIICASPLLPTISGNRLATCFGIASMPADADSPQKLIIAATDALRAATSGPTNIVLYRNIRSR